MRIARSAAGLMLVVVVVVGCAPRPTYTYTPSTYSPPPRPAEPKVQPGTRAALSGPQQQAVKAGVMKRLKDPESARFGKMAAVKDKDGDLTVCGYVNARNSYGGYTGMSPFIGMMLGPTDFRVVEIGSSASDTTAVRAVCSERGIALNEIAP